MTPKEAREARTRAARVSYVERLAQVALVLVAFAVVWRLGAWVAPVMAPIAFSLLLAYFLDPVIDWFEARHVRRTVAIMAVATVVLGALTAFGVVVLPAVAVELGRAVQQLPGFVTEQYEMLRVWLSTRFEVDLNEQLTGGPALQAVTSRLEQAASGVASAAVDSISSLLNIVLIPVFTFYFLRDFDTLKMQPLGLVPPRYHDEAIALGREMDDVVGAWLRGQVQVALILAVFYAVGLGVIGVEMGVFIGLLAGVVNVVPYLGLAIGLGLSVVMTLIHGTTGQLVAVLVLFAIAQVLDDYVIKPRVVGEKVGMGPMMVMAVLLLGGSLFGFFGMLLSIPAVAAAGVVARRGVAYYRESDFFLRDTDGFGEPVCDAPEPPAADEPASPSTSE